MVTNVNPENVDLTKLAIRAFYHSIPYAKNCFSNPTDRTFIFDRVIASLNAQDEEIIEKGLQCLSEFVVHGYEYLDTHFIQMAGATETCSKSESSRVGAQAFEFWTSLI